MNLKIRKFISKYKRLKNLLIKIRLILFRIYWSNTVKSLSANIDSKKEILFIKNKVNSQLLVFPYKNIFKSEPSQIKILSFGYLEFMLKKYELIDNLINSETIIIDCGGFVGGFSIAALKRKKAKHSFYIEPSILTRRCASINFSIYGVQENVSIIKGGLGSSNSSKFLNYSYSPTNNSFLKPDSDCSGDGKLTDIFTLDYLFTKYSIDEKKVFLKLEAEGYEVEIIKGMGNFRPKIISVDISPEMDGISPFDEICVLLKRKSYSLIKVEKFVALFSLDLKN